MILTFGGGLNENPIPALNEALAGYNFDLQKNQDKLRPRRPFDLKGTTPNGLGGGFLQLVKRDGTETTLVQGGPVVYTWDGLTTFTSTATVATTSELRDVYWSLGDYLVIPDLQKASVVKKWTGTVFSDLTTGLSAGVSLYAKYGVVHLNRVWLLNVKTTTDTPHLIAVSAFENPESYSTAVRATIDSFSTGREAFYMLTPDLRPINGVALFHNELIISTDAGRLYKLSGSSAKDFAWIDFYAGSAAIGDQSLVNTGNDVMYMRKGGHIESLVATQQFGDVAADDISRWIPTTVQDLTEAIAVYDQTYQRILFFVSGKVLVLFKDILLEARVSPWSVYKTLHTNSFNAVAAKYMRVPGATTYSVFWMDSAGRCFDLNGTGAGDAAAHNVEVLRKTRIINHTVFEGSWPWRTSTVNGRVFYRRIGQCQISIKLDWADEYNESVSTITLRGPPAGDTGAYFGGAIYFGGEVYFSQGFAFADKESSRGFTPVGRGKAFFASVSSANTVRYEVDRIELT